MTSLNEWKMAQSLRESGRRGIIIGVCVTLLIVIAIATVIALKICWLKKHGFCCCDCDCDEYDDYGGDYYVDSDELDENGCAYTSEKDFV